MKRFSFTVSLTLALGASIGACAISFSDYPLGGSGGAGATGGRTSSTASSSTTSGTGGTSSSGTGASTSSTSSTATSASTTSSTSSSSSSGATCADQLQDGTETDVDCGGGTCAPCATGKKCSVGTDCQGGKCTNGFCADGLVLSQVQTHGDDGANDEFVEIYNPTSFPVTFDATWVVKARSAIGDMSSCATNPLDPRFSGSGQVIPSHGHILFTNSTAPAYNGSVPGDGIYTTGIPDAASVVLYHGNTIVDALCFYFDALNLGALVVCSAPYICEGMPALNPHDGTASTDVDRSLERQPGGSGGNTQDTDENATDFQVSLAADPHNLASAPVP